MRTDEWDTPQDLYEKLDAEFGFNLDPCSTDENKKCVLHYTKAEDGLKQDWGGCRVFCNPPYSETKLWVRKAYHESRKPNTIIVMLLPASTDTRWFHRYIYHRTEIRFVRGRVRFSNSNANAPFASMIVIFRGAEE